MGENESGGHRVIKNTYSLIIKLYPYFFGSSRNIGKMNMNRMGRSMTMRKRMVKKTTCIKSVKIMMRTKMIMKTRKRKKMKMKKKKKKKSRKEKNDTGSNYLSLNFSGLFKKISF